MQRSSVAQSILLMFVAMLAACASAGKENGGDAGMPVDLAGLDLLGVDLTGFPGNDDLARPPCDVVAQTNCGANEKCTLTDVDGGAVCLSDGDKLLGQLCGGAGNDDCIHADICVNETATVGQCRQFCNADTDCMQLPASSPTAGANKPYCVYTLTGGTTRICSVACQPVTKAGPSGCAAGLACHVFGFSAGGTTIPQATDCGAAGAGTNGASCATNGNDDCAEGFGCVSVTNGGTTTKTCRQICRQGNAGDCTVAGGLSCTAPNGTTQWGFCL
jgi:hypothetical protein